MLNWLKRLFKIKAKSSKHLLRFYKEWLEWAEQEDKEHEHFRGNLGLCYSLLEWAEDVDSYALYLELKTQFIREGLDRNYPFGQAKFYKTRDAGTQHRDPVRLAWVRARISDMEGAK